jgi:hypothetical protein
MVSEIEHGVAVYPAASHLAATAVSGLRAATLLSAPNPSEGDELAKQSNVRCSLGAGSGIDGGRCYEDASLYQHTPVVQVASDGVIDRECRDDADGGADNVPVGGHWPSLPRRRTQIVVVTGIGADLLARVNYAESWSAPAPDDPDAGKPVRA